MNKTNPLPLLLTGLLFIIIFLCVTPVSAASGNATASAAGGSDTTGDLLADVQSDDTSGASPSVVVSGDGWYTADKNNVIFIDGFDVSGMNGAVSAATLRVQYSVESGYSGTNSIRWALDGGSLASTGITPTNGQQDQNGSYDLYAQGVDTLSEISTLDIEFTNNDGAGPDAVSFDYVWVEVTYTPNQAPSVPTLSSPSNGSSTSDNTPTFQWQASTDPESDTITYDIQVDDDSGFGSPAIDETGLSGTSHTSSTELSVGTFYWHVRAVDNNSNQSSWSSSWSVQITSVEAAFDFSVGASSTSLVVQQGSSTSTTITVTLVSGSTETVSLSGSWIGTNPSGVTPSFSSSSGTPTYTSTLTFSTTASASAGTFTYRVSGLDNSLTRTVDVTLQISETAVFDFAVTASPDNLTLARGYSDTSTISVSLVSGTAQTVSLSGAWVGTSPTGVSASFSPQSATPSFLSILTFTASSTASAGTFTYRVTGQDGSLTRTGDITVTISTELTLTLVTDNDSYDKGQTIQISGTVTDPMGTSISSGTATIQLSYGDWSQQSTAQISNGAYSDSFLISFGHPEGTWTIEVSVTDSSGNSGSTSKTISVSTPAAYAYYTIQIQSPVAGLTYSRGDDIDISVKVTESGANVENAEVSFVTPEGESLVLSEVSPGTYTGRYSLEWDDPEGTWSVSVEGKKTVDNTFKAGGGYINVEVEPATLQVTLLSPTERKFEVGQSITVSAEVSYPDGALVEDVTVSAVTPSGENLILTYQSAGVYSTNYVVTEQDVGSWTLSVSAVDPYGNSGSKLSVISIEPMGTVGFLTTYWWAVLGGIVAVGVVSAFATRKARLVGRLKRITKEKREVIKLMKEAQTEYYNEGSITREAFDELTRGHKKRLVELEKEERMLKAKVKKVKKKAEPKRIKKKRKWRR